MFAYPIEPPVQKHGPSGYTDYSSYKPWLRDEFVFQCVYCLEREMWYPNRSDSFGVDHIVAKTKDPDSQTTYANLAYACGRCNSLKSTVPLLNPRTEKLAQHLRVGVDGQIEGLSDEGWILIEQLHLRGSPAFDTRYERISLHRSWSENSDDLNLRHLYLSNFGFPKELPNLAVLKPPGGNSRPGSEMSSFYEREIQGDLPEIY